MKEPTSAAPPVIAPQPPRVRLCLGVTGHRADHPSYAPRAQAIESAVCRVLEEITKVVGSVTPPFGEPLAPIRMQSLMADGTDQMAAHEALRRGWDLVALLPFGEALNCAINAGPRTAGDARALLAGLEPADADVQRRAAALRSITAQAQVFELADADAAIAEHYLAMHDAPGDTGRAEVFRADSSVRVALAGQVMIEHSDLVIAVWDGARTSLVGGTGHTVAAALDLGTPVLWVDPAAPDAWRILGAPESLALLHEDSALADRETLLRQIVLSSLLPGGVGVAAVPPARDLGVAAIAAGNWRARSNPLWHAYRWVERNFDGQKRPRPRRSLRQTYETPAEIATGSGATVAAALANLPTADRPFADRVVEGVLGRFAWADGIAAHLSDTYRGSMVVNFLLSAMAVISGVAYLPVVDSSWKWPFAAFELMLLGAILAITFVGQGQRWHGRWFETRRVAEYLRHSPLLLSLGAARATGRWPRGSDTAWPEHYARHALREIGLPRVRITPEYLRAVLVELIAPHVSSQCGYHAQKARRLTAVHHNLDHLSERSFQLAVAAAALYLVLAAASWAGLLDEHLFKSLTKVFTFLGVALPTFGGALSGIRFFGDFERFAAISRVTAGKLEAVDARIALILRAPDSALDYGSVAELAHAADDIVVSEIESWQAVFEAKQITVPA